jgi:hypothetical protein
LQIVESTSDEVTVPHVQAPLAFTDRGNWLVQLEPAKMLTSPVPVVLSMSPLASGESACSEESVASGVLVT